ncbi:hypothetical protein M9H77_22048 [Catharanthus roseus]|uniref:Uncharacterized protein n=1 Tax=Catharanthus roseus TaxID=4058 RepID=A0ACC0APD4_CATRO|nr:hypothetical protein M9H77_22048 [Catharanthus roseus]
MDKRLLQLGLKGYLGGSISSWKHKLVARSRYLNPTSNSLSGVDLIALMDDTMFHMITRQFIQQSIRKLWGLREKRIHVFYSTPLPCLISESQFGVDWCLFEACQAKIIYYVRDFELNNGTT